MHIVGHHQTYLSASVFHSSLYCEKKALIFSSFYDIVGGYVDT